MNNKTMFGTPLLVYWKVEEVDSVKEMLLDWKQEYLEVDYYRNMYDKMKSNKKTSSLLVLYNSIKGIIKYLWPTLLFTILASYMNLAQMGCIMWPTIVIQVVIWVVMLARLIGSMVVISVVFLEKEHDII